MTPLSCNLSHLMKWGVLKGLGSVTGVGHSWLHPEPVPWKRRRWGLGWGLDGVGVGVGWNGYFFYKQCFSANHILIFHSAQCRNAQPLTVNCHHRPLCGRRPSTVFIKRVDVDVRQNGERPCFAFIDVLASYWVLLRKLTSQNCHHKTCNQKN